VKASGPKNEATIDPMAHAQHDRRGEHAPRTTTTTAVAQITTAAANHPVVTQSESAAVLPRPMTSNRAQTAGSEAMALRDLVGGFLTASRRRPR
jgi:hypothetical protein